MKCGCSKLDKAETDCEKVNTCFSPFSLKQVVNNKGTKSSMFATKEMRFHLLLNISLPCLSSELVKVIQGRMAKTSVTQPL